ncbi:MAG: molybdenum cofactor guanylyltransferase [Gemmatimonadota bacterium]
MDAVLVLAGGASRRFGSDKAWLSWGGAPLLLRVLSRLAELEVDAVVVAARPGQALPPGPYRRVDDVCLDAGPLAGLAVGLEAIARMHPEARVAVSACDYPFAEPTLFRALARAEPSADVALLRWRGRLHPLHGVWRARMGSVCARALEAGERRVRAAFPGAAVSIRDAATLAPDLQLERALLNLNDQNALERARVMEP